MKLELASYWLELGGKNWTYPLKRNEKEWSEDYGEGRPHQLRLREGHEARRIHPLKLELGAYEHRANMEAP
jgi:hypothetical protein